MKTRMKIILALTFVSVTAMATMFRVPIEMWCMEIPATASEPAPANEGVCTNMGDLPIDGDPDGNKATVMWCDLSLPHGAPGVTFDCRGNAMVPVYR
ncbi:hypothetical protein [Roseivirga echinicomitans]|uniref:Secreted protein n=1 Tax=Roseivirga echinicomitans TaxID=296218 RepID=A0A150X0S7_9BACT|nr:hypothetical protein [Roseivirga echinicomitans]KYG72337.1 hypothetical protein AWN68_11240 [Roseivirga echinicomitans]